MIRRGWVRRRGARIHPSDRSGQLKILMGRDREETNRWRAQARYARRTIAVFISLIVGVIAMGALPVSTHVSGWGAKVLALSTTVTPQGWGFFTRDPRQPFVTHYLLDSDSAWLRASRGPNVLLQNSFGLNRESRLDEYDLSQTTAGHDLTELWTDCTGLNPKGCAQRASSEAGTQAWTVRVYDRRLCGEVLFIRTDPTPIDYARLQFDPQQEAIVAQVTCKEPEAHHN